MAAHLRVAESTSIGSREARSELPEVVEQRKLRDRTCHRRRRCARDKSANIGVIKVRNPREVFRWLARGAIDYESRVTLTHQGTNAARGTTILPIAPWSVPNQICRVALSNVM